MRQELGVNPSSNELENQLERREGLAENLGNVAVSATESEITLSNSVMPIEAMYPGMGAYGAEAVKQKQAAEAAEVARIEAVRTLDKDAFKLGDLNPLINRTDLMRKESVEAIRYTTVEKIRQNEGMMPKVLESTVVTDPESGKSGLRFIARFEVPKLSDDQVNLLEDLVKDTYGLTVRTRTDSKGNDIPPQSYPPTQPGEEMKSKTGGWYMGPEPVPTSSLHQGLFVFRDLGQINKDNFLNDHEASSGKYIVEIREAGQYQTDLVTFITQVSGILAKEELIDRGELLYETYYDLIRLGLKKSEDVPVYGMEEAADMIRRELIIPLASPEISRGINEEPQSVLMVGVPGTGKTLLVEQLLQQETGTFILPIDPFELQKEVAQPKDKQELMPRIAEIARITGKPVVLHVDDIENMVGENAVTNSTMLNLMAGVQESGFHIIASTNYPEKINDSLIQPQRFSVLIHCGLQDEKARYEILKIHADRESKKLKTPLFESEEIGDIILQEVAQHTNAYTPRYLANITTVAKSHLAARVAEEKGRIIGLTEEDLAGHTFTLEDWERAYGEVNAKYDSKSVADRDAALAKFVKKNMMRSSGFVHSDNPGSPIRIFSSEVHERVIAAQAKLDQDIS